MNKIKTLKGKFSMPNEHDLCHSIQTDFHRMEETRREREKHLLGLNRKLEELKYKVETVEESLHSEKRLLDAKVREATTLNDRLNELKSDKETLLQEVHRLETQRNSLRSAKPNLKDQQTMELGSKKFKYYKQLTGIRWDFAAAEGTIKGYVTNGSDYVHSFNYESPLQGSKLEGVLWKEMEKATGRFAETDENKSPNN